MAAPQRVGPKQTGKGKMNIERALGVAALAVCTISGSDAFAQSNVTENESKAITSAQAGAGTTIMIAPGTYRETLNINSSGNGTITLQASTPGTAVVDGSNVLTGWSKSSSTIYSAYWKDTVGGCSLPANWYTGMPPVVQANEMVFVNGVLMTQVMSSSQLRAGTFYVNKGSSQVQLYPPSGTNMSSAKVEIAARRSVLTVNGKNLVFRGLSFQHAASCMNDNAVTVTSGS